MVGMMSGGDKQQMIGSDEGEEFVVERIVSHRFRNGRKEYLLQWKGFPEEENTWEPQHNLDCPDLIEEYENRIIQKSRYINESSSLKRKSSLDDNHAQQQQQQQHHHPQAKRGRPTNESLNMSSTSGSTNRNFPKQQTSSTSRIEEASAFDRGLEAEKILGATDATGELMLLVQWKGTGEADLVPARICNVKCPQVVIRFYEERLTWITTQQPMQQAPSDSNNNTENSVLTSQTPSSQSNNANLEDNDNNSATL